MKLYIHTTTCSDQMKMFPKVTNTYLYVNKKKTKQENFKSLHIDSSSDSTCTLMWQKLSTWIIIYESMHINWNYDQNIIKLWNLTPSKLPN